MGCKSLKFPTERLFAGGHRGVVTPVPIPNTEVKGSIAEGSAGLARARVGRRRLFYLFCQPGTLERASLCFWYEVRDTGYGVPPAASRCPGVPASCTTAFRCDCIGHRASAPYLRAVPTVGRGRCPRLAVVQDARTPRRQDEERAAPYLLQKNSQNPVIALPPPHTLETVDVVARNRGVA